MPIAHGGTSADDATLGELSAIGRSSSAIVTPRSTHGRGEPNGRHAIAGIVNAVPNVLGMMPPQALRRALLGNADGLGSSVTRRSDGSGVKQSFGLVWHR